MKILDICGDTRQGERELNEDSFVLLHEGLPDSILALVAVADGIGGLGSGHVASSTALTTVSDIFRKLAAQYWDHEEPPVMDWLSFAFQKANTSLLRMGLTMKELRGMGTTCTAAAITAQGRLYICHVGDSRAYLLRDERLTQITEDDWFRGIRGTGGGEAARISGQPAETTLVTQAVGWQPFIDPAKNIRDLQPDDVILLCTDGLTDNLNTQEIESVILAGAAGQGVCSLADTAAHKPGSDNTTLVVVRVSD